MSERGYAALAAVAAFLAGAFVTDVVGSVRLTLRALQGEHQPVARWVWVLWWLRMVACLAAAAVLGLGCVMLVGQVGPG